MAEFCLKCVNEIIMPENKQLKKKHAILAYDLCEGCSEWKLCVIGISKIPFVATLKTKWYNSKWYDKWY